MRYRLPLALIATTAGAASAALALDHTTAATMLGFSFVGMPAFALGGVLAMLDVQATWRAMPCRRCHGIGGSSGPTFVGNALAS